MSRRALACGALAVGLALSAGRPAAAQPAGSPAPAAQALAEKRFRAAEALYKRGEYLAAAAEYQAAYDLSGLAGLLYNVAQSYRLAGEAEKAAASYRLFLERAPDHQLAEVAARREPEPEPEPPVAPASAPQVTAKAPPPAARGRGLRIAGLVSAGVGLVALGAAVHYGIQARQASDAISENQEGWTRGLLDRYDQGESAETRMIVLSGVGGAALAAGGVLYWLGWRAGRAESIAVAPTAGGAALSLAGRF